MAERKLLSLIRSGGLPCPKTNVQADGFELDFLSPEAGLVVEVDSFAHHSDRRAFERDGVRDAVLAARGLVVIRVTWRQLVSEPEAVISRIREVLARRATR